MKPKPYSAFIRRPRTGWLYRDGLELWLRADCDEIYSDAGSTLITDGGSVGQANDQSGNGNDVSETTNKPTWVANVINGKPVFRFASASSQKLTRSTGLNLSGADKPYSILAIAKIGVDDNAVHVLFSLGNSATQTSRTWLVAPQYVTNAWQITNRDDTNTSKNVTGGSPTAGTYLLEFISTGTVANFYVNGTNIAADVDVDLGAATRNEFAIGCGWGGAATYSNFFDGDLAELLVYSAQLPSRNLLLTRKHLMRKYGIAT